MIRRCNGNDRKMLNEYLAGEAVYNTFLLADIHDFGFDSSFQNVYADIENDSCRAVYLKFYNNLLIYSRENIIDTGFLECLKAESTPDVVMGKMENVLAAAGVFGGYSMDRRSLFLLEKNDKLENNEDDIECVSPGDVDAVFEFIQTIPEIKGLYRSKEMISDRIASDTGVHYMITREGNVVSHANSTAQSTETVMIGGVATDPGFRNKGYASRIVSRLCREILDSGRKPCLFSTHDEENNMYVKLGFTKAGMWGTLTRPE